MNDNQPTIPVLHRSGPPPRSPRNGGGLPVWLWAILAGAVLVVVVVLCGGAALYLFQNRPAANPGAGGTPILRTIAAPSGTPAPGVTAPAPTGAPTVVPTNTIQPTLPPPPPGTLAIGSRVQVVNTGGDGVSLRQGPGQSYPRVNVALEGELLTVTDGPRLIGGATWWKLKRSDGVEGWAVQNYLQLAP